MKILFIITQAECGGAQKHVLDLSSELQKSGGFECEVASEENQQFAEKLKEIGVKFAPITHLQRNVNPLSDLFAFFEIYNLIKSRKPDIVHLHSSKAGVLGALAGRIAGVKKIVFTAHGWVFNERLPLPKKLFYILASKIAALFQDAIICVSEYDKKAARNYRIAPAQKLYVVHNGIDINKLIFLNKAAAQEYLRKVTGYRLQVTGSIIGTIANLYKTKAIDVLIEAAKLLQDLTPRQNFAFLVIGEGKEKESLELRIKNYELRNNFFLIGALPEAWKYLKAFDVFILPSHKEGFPYAILEAMAAGLPIIATKVGGVPEAIEHEKTGLLVDAGQPKELAEALLSFAKNPERANKCGQKAAQTIKIKFGLAEMTQKIIEVYQK